MNTENNNEMFVKLSEVPVTEEVSEDTHVLVETEGKIKRVSKSKIGAQADWNETDETSPAFIVNKPKSLGAGVAKYFLYYQSQNRSYLFKTDDAWSLPPQCTSAYAADKHEILKDFSEGPVLVKHMHGAIDGAYEIPAYFWPYNDQYCRVNCHAYDMKWGCNIDIYYTNY